MLSGHACSDRIEKTAGERTYAGGCGCRQQKYRAARQSADGSCLVSVRSGLGVQRYTHLLRPGRRAVSTDSILSADLLALWQVHGTGLVAKHATLHFQDGALTAPSPAADAHCASPDCMPSHAHFHDNAQASMPEKTHLQASAVKVQNLGVLRMDLMTALCSYA